MKKIKLLIFIIIAAMVIFSCASARGDGASAKDDIELGSTGDVESVGTAEAVSTIGEKPPSETKSSGSEKPSGDLRNELIVDDEAAVAFFDSDFEELMEAPASGVMKSAERTSSGLSSSEAPAASGLKAGYADDNRQFGYFLNFLNEHGGSVVPIDLDVSERINLKIHDRDGRSIYGAAVEIKAGGKTVKGVSLADGSYQINPSELFSPGERSNDMIELMVSGGKSAPGFSETITVARDAERNIELTADLSRRIPAPVPLDIVFVMDTTGSMGEEIYRLKNTIQIIHMNLSALAVAADIRFGMVLYKDDGDDYTTMQIPLTTDLEEFQASLDQVEAYGGGDHPEDLEAALDDLVNEMDWKPDAVKIAYVITDAPPHLDYQRSYDSADALRDARQKGIKIFTIGTGGLDLQGEYNLRQIAQYTSARYIFLTYGTESGESSGGAPGSVSHHTGSNWNADKLETIIIRFTREELSHLSDSPLLDEDPWFEAGIIEAEDAEETLANLFDQALEQLMDFSTLPVGDKTLVAVMPFSYEGDIAADAEYFNEHLILAAGNNERIKLAERKDIAQLLNELEFQNLGLTDEDSVGRIGEFLNADILIGGNLFIKDGNYELFLRMMRVETAEVLSVTRAVIDAGLGL